MLHISHHWHGNEVIVFIVERCKFLFLLFSVNKCTYVKQRLSVRMKVCCEITEEKTETVVS